MKNRKKVPGLFSRWFSVPVSVKAERKETNIIKEAQNIRIFATVAYGDRGENVLTTGCQGDKDIINLINLIMFNHANL